MTPSGASSGELLRPGTNSRFWSPSLSPFSTSTTEPSVSPRGTPAGLDRLPVLEDPYEAFGDQSAYGRDRSTRTSTARPALIDIVMSRPSKTLTSSGTSTGDGAPPLSPPPPSPRGPPPPPSLSFLAVVAGVPVEASRKSCRRWRAGREGLDGCGPLVMVALALRGMWSRRYWSTR